MAYVRKPKVFKVSFEEPHTFAGLTLQTRALKIHEIAEFGMKLTVVAAPVRTGVGATETEQMAVLDTLKHAVADAREMFVDALIEWDMVEEDGTPTPADLEGVGRLDDNEFLDLLNAWLTAMGSVDAPGDDLGKGSGSGETFPELSSLMEPLSPSQAS